MDYIDIHNHSLPGIDDGAGDRETSLAMLETAWREGIRKMILTPHFKPGHHNAPPEKIKRMLKELQGQTGITLFPGNEIFYQREAVELLDRGEICTLAGSRYVLVEFLPGESFEEIRKAAYLFLSGGYRPVIAHAERCASLRKDRERVGELIRLGAYIQVNGGSVTGDAGFEIKAFTRKILKERLVHFVATDAHDMGRRRPGMRECAACLEKKYGAEYADKLLRRNAELLLRDEYL